MPLTPEEIESKEFLVVLRGYDKDEVGSFLRTVAGEVRELSRRAEEPQASAPDAGPGVAAAAPAAGGDKFADLGSEMAAVLRSANEAAQTLRQKAEDEANARVQAATDEAAGLRQAASDEADAILAAARQVRTEATQEAADTREAASREAGETRSNAVHEAEQIVEAALARRDRLSREAQELQRRLESAQETLRTLLDIVGQTQLGEEPSANGAAPEGDVSDETNVDDAGEGEGESQHDAGGEMFAEVGSDENVE